MATKAKNPVGRPRKVAAPQAAAPSYSISNCTVTNNSAANEFTRDCITALAQAAEANAVAIERIAEGLKGSNAVMENGIRVG